MPRNSWVAWAITSRGTDLRIVLPRSDCQRSVKRTWANPRASGGTRARSGDTRWAAGSSAATRADSGDVNPSASPPNTIPATMAPLRPRAAKHLLVMVVLLFPLVWNSGDSQQSSQLALQGPKAVVV